MGDESIAETTDEFGRRVTIGPDGSRTVELAEYTIEGDPNELQREKDLQWQAQTEAARVHGQEAQERREAAESDKPMEAHGADEISAKDELLVKGVELAARTFGIGEAPSAGPCPGVCPTCPDELQQNVENHCTLGAGHMDANFSSGHICDRSHTWYQILRAVPCLERSPVSGARHPRDLGIGPTTTPWCGLPERPEPFMWATTSAWEIAHEPPPPTGHFRRRRPRLAAECPRVPRGEGTTIGLPAHGRGLRTDALAVPPAGRLPGSW